MEYNEDYYVVIKNYYKTQNMARKIPEMKKRIAYRLYKNEGWTSAEIADALGISDGAVWVATYGKDRGFSSSKGHLDYLARKQINPETEQPFKNHYEYEDYLARQRINPETNKRYACHGEYADHLAKKRKRRKENRAVSEFIRFSLDALCKTNVWLAEQVGVGDSSIGRYISGREVPSPELLRSIFRVLKTNYQTVEDLMEDS